MTSAGLAHYREFWKTTLLTMHFPPHPFVRGHNGIVKYTIRLSSVHFDLSGLEEIGNCFSGVVRKMVFSRA